MARLHVFSRDLSTLRPTGLPPLGPALEAGKHGPAGADLRHMGAKVEKCVAEWVNVG